MDLQAIKTSLNMRRTSKNPSRYEERHSRSTRTHVPGPGVDNKDPDITRSEFQVQLKEVETRAKSKRGTEIVACAAKPLKFDGTTLWEVLRRKFETVAEHNCWAYLEKSTYLTTALQG
jgi:hypothetical protein